MATQSNKNQMMDALKRTRTDIASLADWLECELQKQSDEDAT